MMEVKSNGNIVKRRFDDFCKETTFHGFIDYYNAKQRALWRGCFWILMIIVFSILAALFIFYVIKNFKHSPLITTYTIKSSDSQKFPKVQLCMTNTINKTKVTELKLHPTIINYIKSGLGEATIQSMVLQGLIDPAFYLDLHLSVALIHVLLSKDRAIALEKMTEAKKLLQMTDATAEMVFKKTEKQLQQIFLNEVIHNINYSTYYYYDYETDQPSTTDYTTALNQGNTTDYGSLSSKDENATTHDYSKLKDQTPEVDYFTCHYEKLKPLLDSTGSLSVQTVLEKLGYDANKIFVACVFMGNKTDCDSIVKPVFDARFGRCFLIDVDNYQNIAGMGLQLLLNTHVDIAWPNVPHTEDGVYIRIDNDYNPTGLNTFLIPLGSAAQVTFNAKHYQMNISEKYNQCHRNMDWKVSKFPVYTSNVCRIECMHQTLMKKCGCTMDLPPHLLAVPRYYNSCMSSLKLSCVNSNIGSTDSRPCMAECKPACEHWQFNPFVTTAKFPSRTMRTVVDEHSATLTGAMLEKSFIYMHLAYGELEYEEIAQSVSLSFSGFVSQVGGHLGLFLGASLFSLVQLIVFIINSFGCRKTTEQKNGATPKVVELYPVCSCKDMEKPTLY